ncbi:dethiobiotin synthase [Nocardioides sp. R-C-SC26]|uniref:dethiobiotin synthase n=1 Tax=Nocardioides sp. R-C-SC26 TaxID=2870414 RepID=UPI001E64029A|nr:dethiobiotin synthase [Nocardioides sp. R-C-SC26]
MTSATTGARRVVVVTGTSTEVGKTIATAALAVNEAASGARVCVVKPVQTGVVDGEPGDADVVAALAGVDTIEFARLPDPLAPDTAARRVGVTLPSVGEIAERITDLSARYDVVLVEGAGGLLVRIDSGGQTLADLAVALGGHLDVEVVLVCAAGLGTLNHTQLTAEALIARGLTASGLVVGSWPEHPGLAEQCNLEDLPSVSGLPILAVIPAGAGALDGAVFRASALSWFV